ncbi:type IV toxin-antitoxin system AbiEi family antitoxin domain-containing protein [Halomonas sp. BM-2019]|uniref:type IV toxin-antitoxin system AbiEi family antitoxin domain-containing protein n=1 Tax=Halomonas sp. BM-2019 TaxID=2811227 RepID=UPI001B3C1A77|nr:MAG: type IV toxin-antitoxin system AbiEi family antitoxin domain-containing protein [Halomonas sp. BM-2019]
MATKVNRLWQQIPHGAVVTTAWLEAHGISANHAAKLTEAGWLKRLGRGAYCRAGDPLTWESGIFALQALSDPASPPFWPGGQTALALQGFAHYLPMGHDTTHLYGAGCRSQLPLWLEKGLPVDLSGSLTDYNPPGVGFVLRISTPERAILEWIAITPNDLLFSSELVDTFTGLNTLRPRRLQALLAGCRSVKTKRAFLVLARHAGHAWYHRLETLSLDLGKGKRQLCKGGRLDKEYQVTVPEAFTDEH